MRTLLIVSGLLFLPLTAIAGPGPDEVSGRIVGTLDGRQIEMPLMNSRLSVTIEGDVATVEVIQTFSNPAPDPLEVEYLFPLNQRAAVYGMEMRIGSEIVQAVIREKHEAEAEFQMAKREGKSAALLTQHRPNMFTQRIANLMPGKPIEVRLRYVQAVPKIDGRYELVIPLIVGPRYHETASGRDIPRVAVEGADIPLPESTWSLSGLPDAPQVAGLDLPETVASERVSLDLNLTSAVTLGAFGSDSHPLSIDREGDRLTARLADGKVLDNRDLVIHYTLGGARLEAAALSHHDERGGFLSLMIEPPKVPDTDLIMARELVFVLDTSGSMNGEPMAASKRFMQAALNGLRTNDYFRIIPFSNSARQMSEGALRATPENIQSARRYVDQLGTGGGTEIDRAIRKAFGGQELADTLRIVVFLSDGYIGGEAQVLRTIRQQIGRSRIYAFGVGNAVNRYLLDAMADEGRGYARYVGLDETAGEVAEILAANLKSPLLTDIEVDWGDMMVEGTSPGRLPDLFAGNSLRIYARHQNKGAADITVTGTVNGKRAEMPVHLELTGRSTEPALPLMWARRRIAALERQVAVGEAVDASNAEITRLGLAFSLQTRNTSFVAVSKQVVKGADQVSRKAGVPLPIVSGLKPTAYPQKFAGSSSPEPEAIFGFLVVAAMTFLGVRRRARAKPALAGPVRQVQSG
ncbi:MAG: VIT and VWA domain-containing protein [Pseudomonadota bacterium]